jgi:hypothetical protein
MRALLAAFLFVVAAVLGMTPALAQDAAAPAAEDNSLRQILETELPPERMALAMKLVEASGMSRLYDEILPTVAEETKNSFIRANPQMQLGIISIVDKIAVDMVKRRPELDRYLARIWASGFSDAEMQGLIDFYTSDVGKAFAIQLPKILGIQTIASQVWGRTISAEMAQRVQEQLRAAVAADQQALQSDIAGPAEAAPADGTQAPAPAPAPQQ